jgi:hypothetical protein
MSWQSGAFCDIKTEEQWLRCSRCNEVQGWGCLQTKSTPPGPPPFPFQGTYVKSLTKFFFVQFFKKANIKRCLQIGKGKNNLILKLCHQMCHNCWILFASMAPTSTCRWFVMEGQISSLKIRASCSCSLHFLAFTTWASLFYVEHVVSIL